jgi:hypothetical protein
VLIQRGQKERVVAHFAQVRIVELLQVCVVHALDVDVGVRREGWFVPGLRDVGPRDAASLADELGVRGASTRRMAFPESRRAWSRLRSNVIRARSAARSSALRLRTMNGNSRERMHASKASATLSGDLDDRVSRSRRA